MLSMQQELPQAENEEPRESLKHGNSDCSRCNNGGCLKHGAIEGILEAAFELSLRDLVELPKIVSSMEEKQISKGVGDLFQRKSRNWEERKQMVEVARRWNSGSVDVRVGLFKWFFPASFGLGGSRSRANGNMEKIMGGKRFKNINLGQLKSNNSGEIDGKMSRRIGGCSPFFNIRNSKSRRN